MLPKSVTFYYITVTITVAAAVTVTEKEIMGMVTIIAILGFFTSNLQYWRIRHIVFGINHENDQSILDFNLFLIYIYKYIMQHLFRNTGCRMRKVKKILIKFIFGYEQNMMI